MDLFEKEQHIYENAMRKIDETCDVSACEIKKCETLAREYETLTKEYGALLRRFRKITKFFDITMGDFVELADKIHYDSLTGVHNRHFLESSLRKNIKKLSRSGSMMSILFLDVDYFKLYNDTYGHLAGDSCLISITDTLLRCVTRESDIVARYGGEEFVIVLPHANERGAHVVANRVLRSMKDRNLPHKKNAISDYVTVSIGGTTVRVNHNHKAADYINRADEAMYMSKQSGRNAYTHIKFKGEEEQEQK